MNEEFAACAESNSEHHMRQRVPDRFTFRCEHGKPLEQEEKNQSEMAFRLMNWALWLGTLALILIAVTSCNEVKLVNTDIESPLRNTCQSGDLDPTFPKCH
jgi:hypothetical protein